MWKWPWTRIAADGVKRTSPDYKGTQCRTHIWESQLGLIESGNVGTITSHPFHVESSALFIKLLKYVLTHYSSLAPNPFFGTCSLALYTPNHMNSRLTVDDWIVGHSTKATGNRLVHAMQLTKVLSVDDYFVQFPKKPPFGDVDQQGDNMYFR